MKNKNVVLHGILVLAVALSAATAMAQANPNSNIDLIISEPYASGLDLYVDVTAVGYLNGWLGHFDVYAIADNHGYPVQKPQRCLAKPGEPQTFSYKLATLTPGNHSVEVWVDKANQHAERNEDNNYKKSSLKIVGAAYGPDFRILTAWLSGGNQENLKLHIKNEGDRSFQGDLSFSFKIGGVQQPTVYKTVQLNMGDLKEFTFDISGLLKPGKNQIITKVDPDQAVSEKNELNNSKSLWEYPDYTAPKCDFVKYFELGPKNAKKTLSQNHRKAVLTADSLGECGGQNCALEMETKVRRLCKNPGDYSISYLVTLTGNQTPSTVEAKNFTYQNLQAPVDTRRFTIWVPKAIKHPNFIAKNKKAVVRLYLHDRGDISFPGIVYEHDRKDVVLPGEVPPADVYRFELQYDNGAT